MKKFKWLFAIPFVIGSLTLLPSCSKQGCPSEVAMKKGSKKPKKNVLGKYKKPKSGLLPKGKS